MKKEYELRDMIYQYQKEISYYSQMEAGTISTHEKNYYKALTRERTEDLVHTLEHYVTGNQKLSTDENRILKGQVMGEPSQAGENEEDPLMGTPVQVDPMQENQEQAFPDQGVPAEEALVPPPVQRAFTKEELAAYDGRDGQPAYAAIDGIVYDLSTKIGWAGGTHFGLFAGRDLTDQFMRCHGGMKERLEQIPVVGFLDTEQ